MVRKNLTPNKRTYAVLVNAWCSTGKLRGARLSRGSEPKRPQSADLRPRSPHGRPVKRRPSRGRQGYGQKDGETGLRAAAAWGKGKACAAAA
nr:pentatricopeptide repeat-containing protein, mitochondrial [Quercus suber]